VRSKAKVLYPRIKATSKNLETLIPVKGRIPKKNARMSCMTLGPKKEDTASQVA
jgi:hypothetical protein